MIVPMGLLLEGMLAILLGVTVFYCIHLDKKLRALRSGQDGLRDIIKGLNAATQTAQSSITQLRVAGEATSTDLKEIVNKGRALADELSLMIEAGNGLADRLEGGRDRAREMPSVERSFERSMVNGTQADLTPTNEDGNDVAALQKKLMHALKEAR